VRAYTEIYETNASFIEDPEKYFVLVKHEKGRQKERKRKGDERKTCRVLMLKYNDKYSKDTLGDDERPHAAASENFHSNIPHPSASDSISEESNR